MTMFLSGWALMTGLAMMALMVELGLMGFVWVGVLALVVLVPKAAPFGERSPRLLALVLATAAVMTWI